MQGNPESWALESGRQLKQSGIQVLSSSTPVRKLRRAESRIQGCLGFPSMGRHALKLVGSFWNLHSGACQSCSQ